MTLLASYFNTSIQNFIGEYLLATGKAGVVIGISGGIDSAICAKICMNALGDDMVHGLWIPHYDEVLNEIDEGSYLGYVESSTFSKQVADWVNLKHYERRSIYSATNDILHINRKDYEDVEPDSMSAKISKGNIMARIRMIVLYDYAYANNLLVVGTSNKSELMLGYGTKWADTVGDIQPIAHLYKTQVFELAKELKVPQWLMEKAPSAGLWEHQTDEEEMGVTYEMADKILTDLHDLNALPFFKKYSGTPEWKYVAIVTNRLKMSRHKNKPIPQVINSWWEI